MSGGGGAGAGWLVVIAYLIAGCGVPISARRVDQDVAYRAFTDNVLSTGTPSAATRALLFERALVERFEDAPAETLAELHARVVEGTADADDVFALAELSFLHAEETSQRSHYLAAATYAWAFLFPADAQPPDPWDRRFRLAGDLYNQALAAGFAGADGETLELRAGAYDLPFGTLDVSVDPAGFRWGGRELVRLVPLADYEVHGLAAHHRWPGLGAPVAASGKRVDPSAWDLVGPRAKVPATVLLRIDDARRQIRSGRVQAVLELHTPEARDAVDVAGRAVPLEVDATATLAVALQESRLWQRELWGFLQRVGAIEQVPQLVAISPYRRGAVPVVFVHGTASSAARWAEMLNQLFNDHSIRHAYQFWFFQYDTGNPIAYSAMTLREALADAVTRLDPAGTDAALRRMVVIGHSQGGLLTKATAVESGNRFWENISDRPLEELEMSDRSRDLLRRALFIRPLPFVGRLVFIATPHHGSYVAGSWLAHQVARLVTLPTDVLNVARDVTQRGRADLKLAGLGVMPTAVDNMTPGNRWIRTMAELPIAPSVHAHSIIAVEGDGPFEAGDDGVVDYQSAHIDGVDSEFVVRSPHSCQADSRTIAEVRRILVEHLRQP